VVARVRLELMDQYELKLKQVKFLKNFLQQPFHFCYLMAPMVLTHYFPVFVNFNLASSYLLASS